ncbi:hypothetical protein G0P98_28485, partial [Yangia sp. PrR004]|nr:hypothetical protein [Salipiger sp. PrR004]
MTITIQEDIDLGTLAEDLKEVYTEYHDKKMTIVSHQKEYEIVYEKKII